jgi:hypothetical protein
MNNSRYSSPNKNAAPKEAASRATLLSIYYLTDSQRNALFLCNSFERRSISGIRGSRPIDSSISYLLAPCFLASPLMVSPDPDVLLRMRYPLPPSTITETCVLLMGGPHVSVTVQSAFTE